MFSLGGFGYLFLLGAHTAFNDSRASHPPCSSLGYFVCVYVTLARRPAHWTASHGLVTFLSVSQSLMLYVPCIVILFLFLRLQLFMKMPCIITFSKKPYMVILFDRPCTTIINLLRNDNAPLYSLPSSKRKGISNPQVQGTPNIEVLAIPGIRVVLV